MKSKVMLNKKIVIYIIIFVSTLFILGCGNTANAAHVSENIDEIDETKYPGYKEAINSLKSQHPTWNFKFYYTDLDWEEVITNEYQGHGRSPKNLSPANNIYYEGEWICPYCKDTTYDSGNWYCASEAAIKYMMDPRGSINSSDIFQFQDLSSPNVVRENVAKMVEGTFLDEKNCIDAIVTVSKQYNINGYYLVARMLQEQGRNGSVLSLGNGYNGNYVGVYNLFNIGAYGSGASNVIMNGLEYADKRGWYSKADSIIGGAEIVAKEYIAIGQNTLYFQKFNVVTSNLYNHQYMQNILAAQREGSTLRTTYEEIDPELSSTYTFLIPIYENMPEQVSLRPSTVTNLTEDVEEAIVNAIGGLKIKEAPGVASRQISAVEEGATVKIILRAQEKVDGYYWDKILTKSGYYGYAARGAADGSKLYLVVEKDNNNNNDNNNDDGKTEKPVEKIELTTTEIKCSPDVSLEAIKNQYKNVEYTAEKIATGEIIKIDGKEYTVVKKGDSNGDGEVDILDVVVVLNYLKGKTSFEKDCFIEASKVASQDEEISILDVVKLLNYLKGKTEI